MTENNIYSYVEKIIRIVPQIASVGYEFFNKPQDIDIFSSRTNGEICMLMGNNSLKFEGFAIGGFGTVGKFKLDKKEYVIKIAHWNSDTRDVNWENVKVVVKRALRDSFGTARMKLASLEPKSYDHFLQPFKASLVFPEPLSEIFFGGIASHLYTCGINPFNIRYFSAFHCPELPVGDSFIMLEESSVNVWTLLSRMKNKLFISINEWKNILVQFLVGIYLNKKCLNLLHMDCHPGNVMVTQNPNVRFGNDIIGPSTVFTISTPHKTLHIPVGKNLVKLIDFGSCVLFCDEKSPILNFDFVAKSTTVENLEFKSINDYIVTELHFFLMNIYGYLVEENDKRYKSETLIDTSIDLRPYVAEVTKLYNMIFHAPIDETYRHNGYNTIGRDRIICDNVFAPKSKVKCADHILDVAVEYSIQCEDNIEVAKRREYTSAFRFEQFGRQFLKLNPANFDAHHSTILKNLASVRASIACDRLGMCNVTVPISSFYSNSHVNHNTISVSKRYKTLTYKRVTVTLDSCVYNVFFITNGSNMNLNYNKSHLLRIPFINFGLYVNQTSVQAMSAQSQNTCTIYHNGVSAKLIPTKKLPAHVQAAEIGILPEAFNIETPYFFKFIFWDSTNVGIIEFDCRMHLSDCMKILKGLPHINNLYVIPGEERVCMYENGKEMYASNRQMINDSTKYIYF